MKTKQPSILQEAQQITQGARQQSYGRPERNMGRIAALWNTYYEQKYGINPRITPEDACWFMVLLKIARQMHTKKRDNLVDSVGYIALIPEIERSNNANKTSSSR